MLRLESCLEGEAAETVKGLGYSDHAYEAAKARLNRKYGGNRRQVQAHIDELRKMRPINADNPRELERFADILERTVVSLKENKKFADLEGGTLYAIVLEKLPQVLLSQYYRWIKEKGSLESLEELRRWVAEEAEYQVQASEIKHGLSSVGGLRVKSSIKSYFGTTEEKRDRPCKMCNQKHPIWKCDMFKGMEHRKKWETAKKLGLCYRCLGKGHLGDSCTWNRECGIDGCKDRHHRLLHEEKVASGCMEGKTDTPVTEENKSSTYETVQEHAQRSIALRTVPGILKHGERRLQVNCFLDEGSDKSIRFDGERYEVAVPWKHERPELPPNRQMAEKRLHTVEMKLVQDEKLAQAYQSVVDDYLSKEYIREVPEDEPRPPSECFLPHFPVVRPEKATTKVRIVFDGSAQQEGKSLNSESLPGPKLQSDIVDVLVKFRKEPVALAGDVGQMYHQILLRPEDRDSYTGTWTVGIHQRFTSLRGLFLEGVTAHFAYSLLRNIMPDFTRRLTPWELMQFWNTVTWMI